MSNYYSLKESGSCEEGSFFPFRQALPIQAGLISGDSSVNSVLVGKGKEAYVH